MTRPIERARIGIAEPQTASIFGGRSQTDRRSRQAGCTDAAMSGGETEAVWPGRGRFLWIFFPRRAQTP